MWATAFGRVDETSSSTLVAAPSPFPPRLSFPSPVSTRTPVDGVIGGGRFGYNAQFSRWVLGIEGPTFRLLIRNGIPPPSPTSAALPWRPLRSLGGTFATGTQTETVNTSIDWFGTVRWARRLHDRRSDVVRHRWSRLWTVSKPARNAVQRCHRTPVYRFSPPW